MEIPDYKQLKKLADACRKAGIKQFKGGGFEFTLTDDAPEPSPYKQAKAAKTMHQGPETPESDPVLSDEEMLFWSAGGGVPFETPKSTE